MGYIRKIHGNGGSVVITIPPSLGYTAGDNVEIEEDVKGVSFRVTRVTKMTAKELETENHGR